MTTFAPRSRVFVIAEAGVNHNGDVGRALAMVDAAAEAKADAIKFQTFDAARLVTRSARKADYQAKALNDGDQTQFTMLRELQLPEDAYPQLVERCNARGIELMSTPFDVESVELLQNVGGVKRMKIGSGDISTAPLLLTAARARLPIIVSTGASTVADVEHALGVVAFGLIESSETVPRGPNDFERAYRSTAGQRALQEHVTLLHCVTEYPAPIHDVNLRAMDTLRDVFGLAVGYSDHTLGITIPIAAVARGATVIEKHFTMDRGLPGPDHAASLLPDELAAMVSAIRDVSTALGSPIKKPAESELANRSIVRRSVVAARAIKKGEAFSTANLTVKRPASGRSPFQFWELLGRVAEKDYEVDDLI